jgi:hypothetical protein
MDIPVPRGWPALVRSALIHAVSLGRAAIIEARSGFENRRLRCGFTLSTSVSTVSVAVRIFVGTSQNRQDLCRRNVHAFEFRHEIA